MAETAVLASSLMMSLLKSPVAVLFRAMPCASAVLGAFLLLWLQPIACFGQDELPNEKDAIDLYESGRYNAAAKQFTSLLEADPNNPQLNYYAGLSWMKGTIDRTVAWKYLEKAVKQPELDEELYYHLARAYHLGHKFNEGIQAYTRFAGSVEDEERLAKLSREMENCFTAMEMIKYPVNVVITNLGPEINSEEDDYTPFVDEGETMMLFNSNRKRGNKGEEDKNGEFTADIYMATIENGKWEKVKNLGKSINSEIDEEVIGMSVDGELMFMNIGGHGAAGQMVVSHRAGSSFKTPIKVEKTINTGAEEKTSTVSRDRQHFYYASNRKGGKGGFDIYQGKRLPDDSWGEAINLAGNINTAGDELYPQLSPDEKTLYFASNGLAGMGGFDIYRCHWDEKNKVWGTPENLGYPINTPDDDLNFTITATGKTAYISGIRPDGLGGLDLYSVTFGDVEARNTLVAGNIQTMVPVDYNNYALFDVYKKGEQTKKFPKGFKPPKEWKFVKADKMIVKPRYAYNYELIYLKDGKRETFSPENAPIGDPEYTFKDVKQTQTFDQSYKPVTDRVDEAPRTIGEAFISVYEKTTDELVGNYVPVQSTGKYVMILPPGSYMMEVEAEGFEFYTEEFEVLGKGSFEPVVQKDITLTATGKQEPIHHSELGNVEQDL